MARLAAFAQMLFLQPQPLQHHARRSLLDLRFLAVLRGEGTSVLTDTKEINRKKIQKITSFYLNSLFLLNAFYNLHNQTKCGRLEPEKDGSGGCAESMTVAWCLVKDLVTFLLQKIALKSQLWKVKFFLINLNLFNFSSFFYI